MSSFFKILGFMYGVVSFLEILIYGMICSSLKRKWSSLEFYIEYVVV